MAAGTIAGGQIPATDASRMHDAEAVDDDYARSIASIGDITGDGIGDYVIGAPQNEAGGVQNAGRAYVISGANGSIIRTHDGTAFRERLGFSVAAAGDVNNDGVPDIILGGPRNQIGSFGKGRVYVYSGVDGDLLHFKSGEGTQDMYGYSVSGAGDVDGDGFADFLVGARAFSDFHQGGGKVYVYSGQTGDLLRAYDGDAQGDTLGWALSSAGDANGDGLDDILIGSPFINTTKMTGVNAGRAFIYSVVSGELLQTFDGDIQGDELGSDMACAGDVDADGCDDVIVGLRSHDFTINGQEGRIFVYSGKTGEVLHNIPGDTVNEWFGASVSGAGDANHDGHDDFLVGAPAPTPPGGVGAGQVFLYSGADGSLLRSYVGEIEDDEFGASVSGGFDMNGDGSPDIFVGAHFNDTTGANAGRAYVFDIPPCDADFNGDGVVAASDLSLLLGAWGTANIDTDLTGDGVVNASDLSRLLGAWGPCL